MSISIRKTIGVGLIIAVFVISLLSFGMTAKAETNTSQLAQIQTLLKMIEQLQAQLAEMQGGGSNVGQCIQLSRSLFLGMSDSETGGEVSKLQQFLTKTGHYTYGKPTGYFGPATQMAVQAWQKANVVVSNGSPETTGYGVTGPSTRSAMAKACKVTETPDNIKVSISSISNSENPTISGNAQGVEKVSFTIHPSDKYSVGNTAVVYDSGDIKVINGKWSHKVSFDLVDAKYFVTVKVNGGDISEKLFTVDTSEATNPPVADAGRDRTIYLPTNSVAPENQSVENSEDTSVTYKWTLRERDEGTNDPVIENSKTLTPTFSSLSAGDYIFRLTVTDNLGRTDTDDMKVTVMGTTNPPVANAGSDRIIILPNTSVTPENQSIENSEDTTVVYVWTLRERDEGTSIPVITNAKTLTPTFSGLSEGEYIFRLTVTDNLSRTDTDDMKVTVKAGY